MIPRDLVKKLRKIEIFTSRLANDQLAGSYHSVFKGKGMAFAEVRQYQPGDDVRFIDWNVSARMNDAYVKVFTEEREMTVMLLVDLSASERFGSVGRPKIEAVAEVAALLAFSAIKNCLRSASPGTVSGDPPFRSALARTVSCTSPPNLIDCYL